MARSDMRLARRLRALRGQNGYTQEQVAKALGIGRVNYTNIESGDRGVTLLEGYKLARLYCLTLDRLVAGVGRVGRDPGQPAGRLRPPLPTIYRAAEKAADRRRHGGSNGA